MSRSYLDPPKREAAIKGICTNIMAFCQHAKVIDEVTRLFNELYIDTENNLNLERFIYYVLGYDSLLSLMIDNECFYNNFEVFVQDFRKNDVPFRVFMRFKDPDRKFAISNGADYTQDEPEKSVIIEDPHEWQFLLPRNQLEALTGRMELYNFILKAGGTRRSWVPLHVFDNVVKDTNWPKRKKEYFPGVGGQLLRIAKEYCYGEVEMAERNNIVSLRVLVGPDVVEQLRQLRDRADQFWKKVARLRDAKFGPKRPVVSAEDRRAEEVKTIRSNAAKPVSYKSKPVNSENLTWSKTFTHIHAGRVPAISVVPSISEGDDEASSPVRSSGVQPPAPVPRKQQTTPPAPQKPKPIIDTAEKSPTTKKFATVDALFSSDEDEGEDDDDKQSPTENEGAPSGTSGQNMSFREEDYEQMPRSEESDSDGASFIPIAKSPSSVRSSVTSQPPKSSDTLKAPKSIQSSRSVAKSQSSYKTSTSSHRSVTAAVKDVQYVSMPFDEMDAYVRFKPGVITAQWEEQHVDDDLEALKSADITLPESDNDDDDDVFEDALENPSTVDGDSGKFSGADDVSDFGAPAPAQNVGHRNSVYGEDGVSYVTDYKDDYPIGSTAAKDQSPKVPSSDLPKDQASINQDDQEEIPVGSGDAIDKAMDTFYNSDEDEPVKPKMPLKLNKPNKNVQLNTPPPRLNRSAFNLPLELDNRTPPPPPPPAIHHNRTPPPPAYCDNQASPSPVFRGDNRYPPPPKVRQNVTLPSPVISHESVVPAVVSVAAHDDAEHLGDPDFDLESAEETSQPEVPDAQHAEIPPSDVAYQTFLPQDNGKFVKIDGSPVDQQEQEQYPEDYYEETGRAPYIPSVAKNSAIDGIIVSQHSPVGMVKPSLELAAKLDACNAPPAPPPISHMNPPPMRKKNPGYENVVADILGEQRQFPPPVPPRSSGKRTPKSQGRNGYQDRSFASGTSSGASSSGHESLQSNGDYVSVDISMAHLDALRNVMGNLVRPGESMAIHEIQSRLAEVAVLSPYAFMAIFPEFSVELVDGKEIITHKA